MKVYHGNSEERTLIGTCKTTSEAFALIEKHVKEINKFNSPYYRHWHKEAELIVDYGSYNYCYYVVFEELENET
ncbi:hypothetical protein [Streptococcus pluranimalium]|uniref:hypothetical protein n=1 Tax=Streptococcus pluranimalium TaxID=82348 RepID=UPI0039FC6D40